MNLWRAPQSNKLTGNMFSCNISIGLHSELKMSSYEYNDLLVIIIKSKYYAEQLSYYFL
jgi:hypothetical protein